MASTTSQRPLAVASERVIEALLRLDRAVDHALTERAGSATQREKIQEEITASWQTHTSALESDVVSLQQQNGELSARNTELANELNALKQQYIQLQHTAGKVAKRLDQSIEQLDMLMESA